MSRRGLGSMVRGGTGRRSGGGMFRSIFSIALSLLLIYAAIQYGPGMWRQYQTEGKVTIPVIGYTIDVRNPSGGVIKPPSNPGVNLPNINLPDVSGGKGSAAQQSSALATLNSLPVKGKAPKTGYSREQFGSAWTDKAGNVLYANNGCDTRNDILRRDLKNIKLDKDGCKVLSGVLSPDPYTGKTIQFERGPKSAAIQIDHIVALGNAWVTGAQQLSHQQRVELANDPSNLVSVDGQANGSKGDRDASAWLPPNHSARCSYVTAQINVKKKYGLWVTPAEKSAMTAVLQRC